MAAEILSDLSRATDSNSAPLAGAQWFFYATGTLTPQSVYTTSALSVAHSNPVTADAAGLFPAIYFDASLTYRGILKTAAGGTIQDIDPINPGILSALAASSGSASIGFLQSGTDAVARTVQDKARETVTPDDFASGTIGAYATDDTDAFEKAIATGKDVYIANGKTYGITGAAPALVKGQRIYGGGMLKKWGAVQEPMFLLPDGLENLLVEDVTIDGLKASFVIGNNVPAFLGYLCRNVMFRNVKFQNVIDGCVKMRDCGAVSVIGCHFYNIGQNGVELQNYVNDPRTGVPYVGTRPSIQGNHRIIGNHFEYIDNGLSGVDDGCGVIFNSVNPAYPQINVTVADNTFEDVLRCIWTENNVSGSEAINVTVTGNAVVGDVRGAGTVQCKNGVGFVAVKGGTITGNSFLNVGNFAVIGGEGTAVVLSGLCEDIEISGNTCLDNTGAVDRTDHQIYIAQGTRINVHHNTVAGASGEQIKIEAATVSKVSCYANPGAASDRSWGQIVPFNFSLQNIPTGAITDLLANGQAGIDVGLLPTAGRVVGMAIRMNAAGAGNFDFQAYIAGAVQPSVTINQTDFGGGASFVKKIDSGTALQGASGAQIAVKVTTDGTWVNTVDANVVVFVDLGMKQ